MAETREQKVLGEKDRQRMEIECEIEAFLNRGGKVDVIQRGGGAHGIASQQKWGSTVEDLDLPEPAL